MSLRDPSKEAERLQWLAGLAVGDSAVVRDGDRYNLGPTIAQVVRITPSQLVLSEFGRGIEYRARRTDGKVLKEGWHRYIRPVNDDDHASRKRNELRSYLWNFDRFMQHMTIDELQQAATLLKTVKRRIKAEDGAT